MAISRWLEYFIYFINIVNCSDTIADWVLSGGEVDVSWRAVMFLYMNLSFLLIYIAEAAIKVTKPTLFKLFSPLESQISHVELFCGEV